jgi:hypothetical protein
MDRKLWVAINDLLDIADGAAKVLDNYTGDEWDKWANQMVPNDALVYQTELERAVEAVEKLMPADSEMQPPVGDMIAWAVREELP